jgi:hypothetical protein
MDEDRWRERMERTEEVLERVARSGARTAVTGALIAGLLLPAHDALHHAPEAASSTAVVHPAHDRLFDRSKISFIAAARPEASSTMAVLPREHDGLHDHRESRLVMVDNTSPVIVTGAGLPSQPQGAA